MANAEKYLPDHEAYTEQLKKDYLAADANLNAQNEQAKRMAEAARMRTAVEAGMGKADLSAQMQGLGLTSGATAYSNLLQENQLARNMGDIRRTAEEITADIERERNLLAQKYASDIRKAQADNDMVRAQMLYQEAKAEEKRLFAQEKEAAKLMAEAGSYSYAGKTYGLSEEEVAALESPHTEAAEPEATPVQPEPEPITLTLDHFAKKYAGMTAKEALSKAQYAYYTELQKGENANKETIRLLLAEIQWLHDDVQMTSKYTKPSATAQPTDKFIEILSGIPAPLSKSSIAQMIGDADLSNEEKLYLMHHYEIAESDVDGDYKGLKTLVKNSTKNFTPDQVNTWYTDASEIGKKVEEILKTDPDTYREPDTEKLVSLYEYIAQAYAVERYLLANKQSIANFEEIYASHKQTVSYLQNLRDGLEKSNAYYGQFAPSEEQKRNGVTGQDIMKYVNEDLEAVEEGYRKYTQIYNQMQNGLATGFVPNQIPHEYGTEEYWEEYFLQEAAYNRSVEKMLNMYKNKYGSLADLQDFMKRVRGLNDDRSWFQSGPLADGFDWHDIPVAVLGSAADAGLGIVKGAAKVGEGLFDLGAYTVAGVSDLFGGDDFAKDTRNLAKRNTIDEWTSGASGFLDNYSVLGDKSIGVAEGIGQIGVMALTGGIGTKAGLSTIGNTALTTGVTAASSMGSGMSEAYQNGATDGQAWAYGAIAGASDAITELLFGGLGRGINALGYGKGLASIDDMLAKALTGKIKNQLIKNLAQYGIKAAGEGLEEVLAGFLQACGKKITYLSAEDLKKIIEDEQLLEQFISGAITSAIAQSGIVPGMKKGSLLEANRQGVDFIQPDTKVSNEQVNVDDGESQPQVAVKTEENSSNTGNVVDDTLAIAELGRGDSVGAAVSAYKASGKVSKSMAERILQDSAALQSLMEQAGMTLPATKAEQRRAVKEAIAKIAAKPVPRPQQNAADTAQTADQDTSNSLPAVPQNTSDLVEYVQAMGKGENVETRQKTSNFSLVQATKYKASKVNQSILQLVNRVKQGLFSANDKVPLTPVSDGNAARIQELTGIDVRGYSVVIEARQIEHILKDHGEEGLADHSMADPENIAKMEYALNEPDSIRLAGTTQAYVTNKNGKMKPADTVLYEKQNGDGSYYVVQAVPDTKKKTLYIVTAFIGKSGYKNMEAPQSTNAVSPGVTPEAESMVASNNSISKTVPNVNPEDSTISAPTDSVDTDGYGSNTVGSAQSRFEHKQATSKVIDNTYKNATDETIRNAGKDAQTANPNIGKYDVVTEKESEYNADLRTANESDIEYEYDDLIAKDGWTGEDNDTAMRVLKHLQKSGDTERIQVLVQKQTKEGTRGGQLSQSFAKYSRETTTARMVDAVKIINGLTESKIPAKFYSKKGFDAWKKDVVSAVVNTANQIDAVADGDVEGMKSIIRSLAKFRKTTAWFGMSSDLTKAAEKALKDIDFDTAKEIANAQMSTIPNDFKKRPIGQIIKTIRIHNMLSSLTTFARNLTGNTAQGLVDGISDSTVGRTIDSLVSKATGKRVVGNDITHAKTYLEGAAKATRMAALCVELDIPTDSESRFSTGPTRTYSPNSGPVMRFLSAFEKYMRYSLEVSDQFFDGGTNAAVEKSLENLGSDANLTPEEKKLIAKEVGKRRTFKDDRMLTRAAKGVRDGLNQIGSENIGVGDMVMPFASIGSNLAHTAMDYSSLGVNGFIDVFRLIKDVKQGKYVDGVKKVTKNGKVVKEVSLVEAQRRAVTNAGRGLTGIGLIAAFTAFAVSGILKVHDDDDKDKRGLEQSLNLSGAQLNIDAALRGLQGESTDWKDGDLCLSVDFLEPFNAQMYIGYLLSLEENVQNMAKVYPQYAVAGIWQSIMDMPLMQGLSDLQDVADSVGNSLKNDEDYGLKDAAAEIGGQVLGSTATSFIPAYVRQMAHVIDPYYRDTTGESAADRTINQVLAMIPGASKTLPKKYSGLGEEQRRYDALLPGILNTFINPGELERIKENEVTAFLDDLSERTGNVTFYPSYIAPGSFRQNGETVMISGKDDTEAYQKTYGGHVNRLYSDLIGMDEFRSLDDTTQIKVLNAAKNYAAMLSKSAVSDYHEEPSYITDRAEGMSEAEAILRHALLLNRDGDPIYKATSKYASLSIQQADDLVDILNSIIPENGKKDVRTIQKIEAVANADDTLTEDEQRAVLKDVLDENAYDKFQNILALGYGVDDYATTYRILLNEKDTGGEGTKERTIRSFITGLGISRAAATKLYECYVPKKS